MQAGRGVHETAIEVGTTAAAEAADDRLRMSRVTAVRPSVRQTVSPRSTNRCRLLRITAAAAAAHGAPLMPSASPPAPSLPLSLPPAIPVRTSERGRKTAALGLATVAPRSKSEDWLAG